MTAKVILTAMRGLPPGTTFVFSDAASCVLGRAEDCDLHVPNDAAHQAISRHHCLLSVHPPLLWVRDLGSKNGTYVNAVNIGQGVVQPVGECPLEDGDALQLGNVLLSVHVLDDADRAAPRATVGLRRRDREARQSCVKQ